MSRIPKCQGQILPATIIETREHPCMVTAKGIWKESGKSTEEVVEHVFSILGPSLIGALLFGLVHFHWLGAYGSCWAFVKGLWC